MGTWVDVLMEKGRHVQGLMIEKGQKWKKETLVSHCITFVFKAHLVKIKTHRKMQCIMLTVFPLTAAVHLTAAQEDFDQCPSTDMFRQVGLEAAVKAYM